MKSLLSKVGIAAASLIVIAAFSPAGATSLQRTDVPADPMWLVHMDFDRLRPTTVGQYIMAELEKPEAQAKLASFQAMFKFDLKTQLHALTLYGMGEAPEQAVLVTLSDEYATTDEREATLQTMIASLTPVTEQSLPALRRNFYAPDGLDGKG